MSRSPFLIIQTTCVGHSGNNTEMGLAVLTTEPLLIVIKKQVYAHTHTRAYTHVYKQTHTHVHTPMYTNTYTCTHPCTQTQTHTHTHAATAVYQHICNSGDFCSPNVTNKNSETFEIAAAELLQVRCLFRRLNNIIKTLKAYPHCAVNLTRNTSLTGLFIHGHQQLGWVSHSYNDNNNLSPF